MQLYPHILNTKGYSFYATLPPIYRIQRVIVFSSFTLELIKIVYYSLTCVQAIDIDFKKIIK